MLQAKSEEGVLITPASLTTKEIKTHQKENLFYCPTCKEQVIMKAGTKNIPHFAHKSQTNCPSSRGGESSYHELGKLMLYKWLMKQRLQVKLEPYISKINQRPDLLLEINNKKIAIEFQCARVSVDQIQQRNKGYKTVGIIPIWILGAKRFKRQMKHHIKIDQFTLQFIHQFSLDAPPILFYFCPNTLQFTVFQDIYVTKMGQALGKLHFSKLNQIQFQDIFIKQPFLQTQLYALWKKEKQRFRLQHHFHLYGKELEWHQWLYLKETHLEQLPSIIYLPVSSQYAMKTPPWNWQSRLCLDLIQPLELGSILQVKSCEHLLRNHLHRPNYFPLIKSLKNPINQYLQLLAQLKVIKQISPSTFVKWRQLEFHKNVEVALQGDEWIMNQLANSCRNKIQA